MIELDPCKSIAICMIIAIPDQRRKVVKGGLVNEGRVEEEGLRRRKMIDESAGRHHRF